MTISNTSPRASADAEPIRAPADPRDHADLVAKILANGPKTDDELFRAANDNGPSGAKTHSWPAMRLNAGEGNEQNRALLTVLADLFELAATPSDNVTSTAGLYESDGELALADLLDEVTDNEDGQPGNPGYGVDCCMRDGTSLERMFEAGMRGAYCSIFPDGRKGAERAPNFRVVHAWQTTLINGEEVKVKFTSRGLYRTEREVGGEIKETWRRVLGEDFYAPRGPDPEPEQEYKASSSAVFPSGNVGATHVLFVAEDPVDARKLLDRLRASIGDENFEVLRRAVVDKWTARAIGDAMGKRHNAASALGTALIQKALKAANDNFPALARAA